MGGVFTEWEYWKSAQPQARVRPMTERPMWTCHSVYRETARVERTISLLDFLTAPATISNRKSQRLGNIGTGRINKVSAMKPVLAKIIQKVRIWRIFERTETDLCIAANAGSIDYADTWSSKRVHWLSTSSSTHCRTTYCGWENTVEVNTGGSWPSLLITRSHQWVAQESNIQWIPATLHNPTCMDHRQVCHGSAKAIPILDPVDVEMAYGSSASQYHCIQWHVRSYGWRYGSFGWEEDALEGRLILCREVWATEVVQMFYQSNSKDQSASVFSTYPRSFSGAVIVLEVGQGNGYHPYWREFVYHAISGGVSEVCAKRIQCQTLATVCQ